MNSLRVGTASEASRPDAGDYFIVTGENCSWLVSTAMARHIEAMLDAESPARWVRFVDLSGSRILLRARQIDCICQCTAEQRARERDFARRLRREAKSDRSWGEDE